MDEAPAREAVTKLDVRLERVEIDPDGTVDGWRGVLVVEDVPVCVLEAKAGSRPRICSWQPGGDPQDLLAVFVAVRRGDWPGISTVGELCGRMAHDAA
jgi:hypothetical protein